MTVANFPTDRKSTVSSAMDSDVQSVNYGDDHRLVYGANEHVALRIAKMISCTLIAMSAIIGVFIFMSALVQSRGSCRVGPYASESRNGPFYAPLTSSASDENNGGKRMPLRIQMDASATDFLRHNKKGHMSCAVEKKTATQIIASEPKLLITPYGNITTDPRLIQLKGEKMVFTCSTKDRMLPRKNKVYRKYGTVINLNALEPKKTSNNETELDKSVNEVGDKSEDEPKDRTKRSTNGKKKECACDCTC
ncbi:hypothetical protein HDE_04718 [Halotydeus destructor]|nr:hypothetical protein HDE_04718 [Halotydeus destructor]